MTPRIALAGALAFVTSSGALGMSARPEAMAGGAMHIDRHHYSMTVRVRPLLVFWISRSDVGDAVITRRTGPGEIGYSLLIGSAPDRAPRRINRWGYIDEEIRGDAATLVGLMTTSDEASLEDAEAAVRSQPAGRHLFKIIRATIEHGESRSVVSSLGTSEDFDLRQAQAVLNLAGRGAETGRMRTVRLPPGTRPGFLSALAELVHFQAASARDSAAVRPGPPLTYVYHSRLYELRAKSAHRAPALTIGSAVVPNLISAEFENRSLQDGELTRFSLTFGIDGALAEVPLTVSYRPRWWMQVDLTLDDPSGSAIETAHLEGLRQ